jgi:PAS domain S-box-containing protein
MENSIDVVFLIDKRGVFTEVNDAFLDEGNYRREDVIGKDFSFMVHPDDAPIATDAFQQGLRGEPSKFEMRARKRDGIFNWYSFISRPILDSSGATVSIHGIARNITERKEAEEALRERERQLSAVTESLTGPVSRVDRDLRYLYANGAYERWHGRSPQAIMGLTIREVIGDEGFRKAEPYLKRALAGERVTFEGPVESPAGDVIYGLVTYVPDVNSEGKVEGLFIIVTDITERKKAEEALRTSEEKYRVVVENGNEAILVAQDNMLKFVNPQTERHSGYSSEELLGKPFIEFVHPEDRDALIQRYKERLAGKPAAHPARFRVNHKNGEIRWAETEVVTIDWEGRPATLVFAHDITEQRRAAEALRESEDRFRTLFESSKDAILIVAAAGEIVAINSAGRDLFGYTEEEIASINAMDFYVNPDDRDRFRRRIETQGYTKDFEITYRKKDGTLVECLETATVVRDSEGRVVGYQGAIRDVTEHKRMEHRLIQAEKLSSLGGMISGVAHELNNPLTSIIGNAQLLMRKEILPDFRNKLEVIQSESVRCTKIVGGLLSFAREHKPERRMIDVNTVLMESLRLREYDLKVNNVHVDTKLADDLPETSADPYQLQQVFINLINNSHDALREKGGGTLSIRSSFKDDFVRVVFTDDGPGIEPGNLNRIFDPFFTTKDVGKGTGLGLSIAYGIIHEHGGTIDAESRPGKGSLFTIRIPIVQQNDPAEQDEEAPSSKKPVRKRGILIVEDEESLGKFISEALVEEGYSVRTVSRGEEAIELLKVLRFDLIITDLKMPGVGGKELYTYIRKHVPNLADRVLFMTGDVLGKDTQRFLEITGNPCIEKPFDLARLFMMISEIFGKQD